MSQLPKLKIDATSGASGDMFLASLIDILTKLSISDKFNVDMDGVYKSLETLARRINHHLHFHIATADRAGVSGLKIDLHEDSHHTHHHHHDDHKGHSHGHDHHSHHHVMYTKLLKVIAEYTKEGIIDSDIAQIAQDIYVFIAKAESKAHGVHIDKVHFHELGEDDSIFDVLANAFLLNVLKRTVGDFVVESTPIEVGSGNIMTSHGMLAVPAPATQHIITDSSLKITNKRDGECLTPTGAGILAYLDPKFLDVVDQKSRESAIYGIGCGSRNPIDKPNILKLELELN